MFQPSDIVSIEGFPGQQFTVKYKSPDGERTAVANDFGQISTFSTDTLTLVRAARAQNTGHNEIAHTVQPAKENTMSETTATTVPLAEDVEPELEETQTRLQAFVNEHPRAAKLVAITGGVLAIAGGVHFTRTVKANRDHLSKAGDHAKGAVSELSNAASPTADD